jgi:hypothetical protein
MLEVLVVINAGDPGKDRSSLLDVGLPQGLALEDLPFP